MPPASWVLEDGQRISAWANEASPVVVLVIDPAHSFTCATQIADWLEWRQGHPRQFRIVFSRPPSGPEEKSLRLVRLPVDGVLRHPPAMRLPAELVFEGGTLVYADSALEGRHSPLLARLRSERLHDMLASSLVTHE